MRFTYAGDANADGVINGDDYTLLDLGFATSDHRYVGGDFNYDGVVNGNDFTLIDVSYALQGTPVAGHGPAASSPLAAAVSKPQALPEAAPSMADADLLGSSAAAVW